MKSVKAAIVLMVMIFLGFSAEGVFAAEMLTTLSDLDKVRHPKSVETIFINNTELTIVPPGKAFKRFKNLKYLFLTGNKIKELPNDLCKYLPNLIQLNLSGNSISEVPEKLLYGAQSLKIVKLEENLLRTLPEDFFVNSPNLEFISLAYNNLTILPKDVFSTLDELNMLLVYNNVIPGCDGTFKQKYGLNQADLRLIFGAQNGYSRS